MKDLKNVAGLPKPVQEFVKYVAGLKFEEEPDYDELRGFFTPEVKKVGGKLEVNGEGEKVTNSGVGGDGVKKGKKAAGKRPAVISDEDSVSGKENNSSPIKKVRKVPVNKAPVLETDSEEEFDLSPVPAKKAKKATARKVNVRKSSKAKTESEGESEDMFTSSPSPMKKMPTYPKYQEAACQTSPAFVAAAKAARKGKKALAQSEYKVNGDTPTVVKDTPSKVRNTPSKARDTPSNSKETPSKAAAKNTPTRSGRSTARSTPNHSSTNEEVSSNGIPITIPGISNPTPAMLAIFQRKQQAEEEKAGKKRKKP